MVGKNKIGKGEGGVRAKAELGSKTKLKKVSEPAIGSDK